MTTIDPKTVFAFCIAACLGAGLRLVFQVNVPLLLGALPVGTLIANALGCLIAGVILAKADLSPTAATVLMGGFLGSLTTFSAFSWETLQFFRAQDWSSAISNIVLNLGASLFFVWFGFRFSPFHSS